MTIEKFKNLKEDTLITAEELESLKAHIGSLENLASEGRAYREHLISEIKRYALIIMPTVNLSAFIKGCDCMDIGEVKSLCKSLREQADSRIPAAPQLAPVKETHSSDNSYFKI